MRASELDSIYLRIYSSPKFHYKPNLYLLVLSPDAYILKHSQKIYYI
jgi:hypothetical protein